MVVGTSGISSNDVGKVVKRLDPLSKMQCQYPKHRSTVENM